ncbi:RHS repeat-associated core domain-containing protein [Streptosporangium sp. CA-115845]|uniref:RHS repeat domain-containing protein n=1 Tax=Streptosporangium sp. CA-115845 TaxID=3240071 RepID=UPI003D8DF305
MVCSKQRTGLARRLSTAVVWVGVASLTATMAVADPAVARQEEREAVAPPRPSPGAAVSGATSVPSGFVTPRDQAKATFVADKTAWPAAATAAITLAPPAAGTRQNQKYRAPGVPLWAQAVGAERQSAGSARLDVRVLDRSTAKTAGINGVLFSVAPGAPVGSATGGAVRVGLDYGGFAQAFGGNYGSRLRLVRLPACVLTTPEDPKCQKAEPLDSANDGASQSVSARVGLDATDTAGGAVVLAAVADAGEEGGKGGTYAATDLKPSGSWAGGGNTGSFRYSYPITVPPATSKLVPEAALSYDSGSVDGQTSSTAAQASWAGDGWGTPQSFIEQTFVSCKDNPGGKPSPVATSDRCYGGPLLTMSLNGASSSLVWNATKKVWKPTHDDGSVVTRISNSNNGSGTYNTDYWQVVLRDGTVYEFGRNHLPGWSSGKAATNSVDHIPVYSPHSGDPCYNSSGFSSSVCTMAYRWNLDYVKDVHGNAMAYYYKQDVNYYGRNKGATDVAYIRDSHLDHIDYGFTDGGAYRTPPNRIVFGTGDRCLSGSCQPLNDSTKANWPDVPYDLVCGQGKNCEAWGPSFFSTVRLTSISTQQYSTATSQYAQVDSYALSHTVPPTGDGNSPTLWLASITRTGHDTGAGGSSAPIALPSVSFSSIKLQNRVDALSDGLNPFYRHRIETITTETGSQITAEYERPVPCTAPVTLNPATNTSSCYPVHWTPDGYTAPIRDWFNKYAVTRVVVTDPTGGAPASTTGYRYQNGAAWHYDDNEVVKAKYRGYGQFRGYGKVQTFVGDGVNDPRTLTESTYYRGMSKNNNSTVVNLTDSAGGVHEDVNELAGSELETTSYRGEGGAVDNSTITSYWVSSPTATRTRTGLPALTANWVAPVKTYTRQAVTGGETTTWRLTETDHSYDANLDSATVGLLKHTYTHTVPAEPAYDQCTTYTYAPVNTTKNLVGLISEQETVSVACGGFTQGTPASVPGSVNTLTAPANVDRPEKVVSNERSYYDDPTFSTTFPQTTAPSKGDVTMTRRASGWTSGSFGYQTGDRSVYDSYGRVTTSYAGEDDEAKTVTAYTMNSVGLTTGLTVTNPLGHVTSTVVNPVRGQKQATTDPNGVVTNLRYDALGRGVAVWLRSRPLSSPANYKFGYSVSKTGINATTTQELTESQSYRTSTIIYDSLLRTRQNQSMTPQGGRMVTDTFYDSRGWVRATYNGWWDATTTPNTTLVSAPDLRTVVTDQNLYTYDGLGRTIIDARASRGVVISSTTTVYSGDRTTVIPPTGGVAKTTVIDPLGRTSRVLEYTAPPTLRTPENTFTEIFGVTGGETTSSAYGYDGHGNQATVTDAGSNTWASTYDLLGQVVKKSDPDAGTSTMKYDDGHLVEVTDSRGKTVSYTYDRLGRRTGSYAAPVGSQSASNRLSSMVYDNTDGAVSGMSHPIGRLTTSTAYWEGAAYTRQMKGFDVFGNSLGETIVIPSGEGPLAGSYDVARIYTPNSGMPSKVTYRGQGGLPAETLVYGYTGQLDLPKNLGGSLAGYVQNLSYDAWGRVNQQTIGGSAGLAYVTRTFDTHTGRLAEQRLTRATGTPSEVDKQVYDYDLAGNVTRQVSARWGSSATSETQCYGYDALARLTKAWTATDGCSSTPTANAHGMVGDNLGEASAYWIEWEIDPLGNQTKQIQHDPSGGPDTTTTHTYGGSGGAQPHILTGTSTTGGATARTSYSYDSAGNMTRRSAGQGEQTLVRNEASQLVSVTGSTSGDSTFVYDADGNLLLQKDPGATTLYLPHQQHTLDTTTRTVSGIRHYPLPGGGNAIRTGGGNAYGFAVDDRHGTPVLYLNSTAQTPLWRQYTPYGAPRGTAGSYPDNRGFLNKPMNEATGLTRVGARDYDPSIGRFVSLDPIQDTSQPQQWNGYSYANNSPVTLSDPTGLIPADCREFDCYGYSPKTGCPHGCGSVKNIKWGKRNNKSTTKSRRYSGTAKKPVRPRPLGPVAPGVTCDPSAWQCPGDRIAAARPRPLGPVAPGVKCDPSAWQCPTTPAPGKTEKEPLELARPTPPIIDIGLGCDIDAMCWFNWYYERSETFRKAVYGAAVVGTTVYVIAKVQHSIYCDMDPRAKLLYGAMTLIPSGGETGVALLAMEATCAFR